MRVDRRKQLATLGIFLAIYALLAFMAYLVTPLAQLAPPGQTVPSAASSIPRWQIAAGGAAMVLVLYGVLGLAGYWFAGRLGLPPMYRDGAGWRAWFLGPMLLGLVIGGVLVILDQIFVRAGSASSFPHPAFPLSVIASAAAGIGEEILFRGFVMGLWALIFSLILQRRSGRTAALWIGNGMAALAFSAVHIPTVMILMKFSSPAEIPALTLAEVFLLNTLLGLVAGARYMRDGLVSAMGVHFWADLVWHVFWPLLGLSG